MRLFALCMLPALAAALLAGEYTVTLTDHTGRGFAPDLVTYTIPRPANPAAVRVLDGAGAALPAQVTIGADGQAALSFVTALPPGATVRYTLRDDGQGPAAAPAVSATQDGDALILANQLLAVKTPAPQTKTFDRPVAAEALPAPILAFRGPDGAWRGAGSLRLKRPVTQFAVTRTAQGPVFTEVRYRLDYAGGGYYQATVRVTDRAPFAQVREEYDLGTDADTDCWQLDLSAGWQPDAAEHMNVAGQGNGPVQYPSLAQEEKAKPGNINPALNTDNGGDLPPGAFNGPWRAGKGTLYEGGIRVPAAIRWPGQVQPGSQCDRTSLTMDVVPTVLQVAGLAAADDLDGRGFLPALKGQAMKEPPRDLFWGRREGGGMCKGKTIECARRGEWKFIRSRPGAELELYNLAADPYEKQDLAGSEKDKLAEMAKVLADQLARYAKVPWQAPG